MSSISKCKACQADIRWIRSKAGKSMPVDPSEFPVVPDDDGNVWAVTDDGEVFRGRTCSESYEAERWVYAMVSHFATCPNADQFRKR